MVHNDAPRKCRYCGDVRPSIPKTTTKRGVACQNVKACNDRQDVKARNDRQAAQS